MIPNEIIDNILDKTDIVELVAGFIQLRKAGQNFKARCPFHEEKTASFVVSPAKQIYHCFGCGAGGNAIGFLMKHERMDFIEAIKILSDKTNIPLPSYKTVDREKNSFADKLYAANNVACNLYQENLGKGHNKPAYNYFIERSMDDATIKHFRLGFAEDLWQGLINHCKSKNANIDILEKAGLVLQNEGTKNLYDRFRNRVTFPIFDLRNRVIGFGARPLDNSMPKYINSPETYIYKKGKQLYGLNFSKEHIRKQNYAIIVEGYFDLILPFKNGIRNIVATLGTALTKEHIGLLKRFTKNVIMIYDSDKAGEAATLRSLDALIEEDMNIRIAILPKGLDPDNFVIKEGNAGFMKALKESKDLFDYKLGTLTAKFKKTEPRGKARIVGEMLPTLAKIKNSVLRSSYLKKMAEELFIDEESIRMELNNIKPDSTRISSPVRETQKKEIKNQAEVTLLAIVLEDVNTLKEVQKEIHIDNIKDKAIANLFKKIIELQQNSKNVTPSHLMNYFEDGRVNEIISEAVSLAQIIKDKEKALKDCLKYIKEDSLKDTLHNIQFRIKEAETASDINRVNKLVAEYNEIIKGFKQ